MNILYIDESIIVCEKPRRVLSTDEPGGLPDLLRMELGDPKADIRTVHRLDRVVGGLMVLARSAAAASALSSQIRDGRFRKIYLAVIHGTLPEKGTLVDLLYRDKARKMTFVADQMAKGIQEASLSYEVINSSQGMSRVRIELHTGRTHQIRVQFAGRGYPLVGERKYSERNDNCELALWSCELGFIHPISGEKMTFILEPPAVFPWTVV